MRDGPRLTDDEVDALPSLYFKSTTQRMKQRLQWGQRAGRAAYKRGTLRSDNPFVASPAMPMQKGWFRGWDEAMELRSE